MKKIQLMIAGAVAFISIPAGMQPAHGKGLDGVTNVESLKVGQSPEHAGKHFVQDSDGNAIRGTANEIFVAAQVVARTEGYELIARKLQ